MANTSLPNLTERTATANTDLIHVNSGGTDYKETKGNFLSDVNSSISALNNSLTNIRTSGQFLGYKDKYITNVSISYDNSYVSLGDVYNDFGIPSGAYVISFLIRGWSGSSGTLMLMAGSDGKTIYLMSNKAGTIGSITVRVWYAILN